MPRFESVSLSLAKGGAGWEKHREMGKVSEDILQNGPRRELLERSRRDCKNEANGNLLSSKSLMAGSSRTSFQKRQKERARQEKQAEKAQKRLQKKQQKDVGELPEETVETSDDPFAQPAGLDFDDF